MKGLLIKERKMRGQAVKQIPLTFVATYPPRKCGIGTFTNDLARSISDLYGEELSEGGKIQIVALNDRKEGYGYGDEVNFEIRAGNQLDYRKAADFLNLSSTRAVCLQHEYGIFGGDDGEYILPLLSQLGKPVVTTFHTVLQEPTPNQERVLQQISDLSTEVVVLAHKAAELLEEVYGVPRKKVKMIPHGAPDVPFLDCAYYKEDFNIEGRKVILTFGLLGPSKGLEVAIEAMEEVVREFPESLYIILGATHPNVKRERGEEYRISLEKLVANKGLEHNVVFHNRFVSLEKLIQYLVSADIYLTPYLSREQISSGTLAYAVACGKAIVSTPYWYAQELLDEERGILVPFGDSDRCAGAIIDLLGNESKRQRMRKRAYQFGRNMIWPKVASSYTDIFEEVHGLYQERAPIPIKKQMKSLTETPDLPEVNLDHLRTLTDGTGIVQHASFTIPNRKHGYTTDDNARAAIATLEHWKKFKDGSVLPLLSTYLSFLHHAYNPDNGRVRNLFTYDGQWIREQGSEDSHGRFIWTLGRLVSDAPSQLISGFATQLFHQALGVSSSFTSPRSWAFCVLGSVQYLNRFEGDRNARLNCKNLAQKLLELFQRNGSEDWPWGENIVSYENARLPQALLAAGRFFEDSEMTEWGLKSIRWLIKVQTDSQEGHLSLIGNDGWLHREGGKAKFDQQPVDAAALIDACWEGFVATGEKWYLRQIEKCFSWFLGQNDLGTSLYDFSTGGCKDGLHPSRVNQNEGAESLLSWLLALHRMYEIVGEVEHNRAKAKDRAG